MPSPQLHLRVPEGTQDLFKRIAKRVQDQPELADEIRAVLDGCAPADMRDELADLRRRLEALEDAHLLAGAAFRQEIETDDIDPLDECALQDSGGQATAHNSDADNQADEVVAVLQAVWEDVSSPDSDSTLSIATGVLLRRALDKAQARDNQ